MTAHTLAMAALIALFVRRLIANLFGTEPMPLADLRPLLWRSDLRRIEELHRLWAPLRPLVQLPGCFWQPELVFTDPDQVNGADL